jgi:hypothetical protein
MILPALVCFELKRAVVSSTTRNLDHVRVLGTVFAVSKSNECTVVSASLGAPGYRLRDPALRARDCRPFPMHRQHPIHHLPRLSKIIRGIA